MTRFQRAGLVVTLKLVLALYLAFGCSMSLSDVVFMRERAGRPSAASNHMALVLTLQALLITGFVVAAPATRDTPRQGARWAAATACLLLLGTLYAFALK